MITASMTSGEMRRVRNLDEARIYEFQMRKANELKREMRKQNVRQITKTFELATPNADYFIVVGVKHGDVFASGLFIYLKETNEYIPMSRNEGYSEDCFAMSVHFLKRFAERFLKKDLPILKILQKIYTSFTGAVQLYSDDKTKSGICYSGRAYTHRIRARKAYHPLQNLCKHGYAKEDTEAKL